MRWLDDARILLGFRHTEDALARAIVVDVSNKTVTTYAADFGDTVVAFFDREAPGAQHAFFAASSRSGLCLVACNLSRDVGVVREDPEQPGAYYLHEAYDEAALVCQTPCQSFHGDERETLVAGLGVLATGVTRAAPPADPSLPVPPDAPPASLVVLLSTAGLLSCYALADDERPASRVAAAPLPAPAAAAAGDIELPADADEGAEQAALRRACSGTCGRRVLLSADAHQGAEQATLRLACRGARPRRRPSASAKSSGPADAFGGAAEQSPTFSFAAPAPAAAAGEIELPPMPTKAPSKLPFGAPAPAAAAKSSYPPMPTKAPSKLPFGAPAPAAAAKSSYPPMPTKAPSKLPFAIRRLLRRPARSRARRDAADAHAGSRASFRSARRRPRRPRSRRPSGSAVPRPHPRPLRQNRAIPRCRRRLPASSPLEHLRRRRWQSRRGWQSAPAAPTTQEELPEGWSLQVPKDAEEAEKWRVCLEMEQAMAKMRKELQIAKAAIAPQLKKGQEDLRKERESCWPKRGRRPSP